MKYAESEQINISKCIDEEEESIRKTNNKRTINKIDKKIDKYYTLSKKDIENLFGIYLIYKKYGSFIRGTKPLKVRKKNTLLYEETES